MHTLAAGFYPSSIKAQIKHLGLNFRQIAQEYGCTISQISNALRGPCFPGEQAISQALNTPAHVIWPDRYNSKGETVYSRIPRLSNANITKKPSQNEQAA